MTVHNRLRKIAAAGVTTIALSVGLAACGGDDVSNDPSASQTASNGDVFNDADVQFATEMIPHHAQAIEMVTLTEGRTLDPEVQELADEIRAAQAPEVETMVAWLTAWDQEVPETSLDGGSAGHDMSDMEGMEGMEGMEDMSGMPGMMSEDDMTALAEASDEEFQEMWLEMMIEHHTGAIEMAQAEQQDGEFADAITLAESIETGQQAEIDRMEGLLGS